MPRGKFDAFMVAAQIGTDRKLRRLDPAERWAFVAGVLALAAESPHRGTLLIADGIPVVAADVAEQASVSDEVAEGAMEQLRLLGLIEQDPDHGCERVRHWNRWNPPPRPSDSREAWAARKRAQRERDKAKATQEPAPVAAPAPSPSPTRRRRGRQDGPQQRPVALDEHPATPPARAVDAITQAVTTVVDRHPASEVFLTGLHVHRVEAGTILVGVAPEQVGWVNDRLARALSAEAGHPVRAVACGQVAA